MANEIITYSDGYQWVVISTAVAKFLVCIGAIEVCELYIDEDAEGRVDTLEQFNERLQANPNAIFAVGLGDLENVVKEVEDAIKQLQQ